VLYNPVDDVFKQVDPTRAKRILGLDTYQHVILSIQTPRQDNYEYLKILDTITQKTNDVIFVLVTRTKQAYNYFYKYLKKYNNAILFDGIGDDNYLNLLYNASDLYFTISRWEGFGYPLAESMYLGKPVIGYDTTAISELILNGFNGFKVPVGRWDIMANAILAILKDNVLEEELSKNAKLFALRNFSLDITTQKLLKLYKEASNL
jgi:glycosyltransferase involved in cell wall biosynthesis